jgi:hypothetical protein
LGRHDYSAASDKGICEEQQQQQQQQQQSNNAKNSVPSSERGQLNFEVSFINQPHQQAYLYGYLYRKRAGIVCSL